MRWAVLAQNRGDYEEAERLYRESLEISEERLVDLAGKAVTLHGWASCGGSRGGRRRRKSC
jgi:hypothetical protein